MKVNINFSSKDSQAYLELLGCTGIPKLGESFNILDSSAEIINMTSISGLAFNEFDVFNFIINNLDSITASILAAFLYDKLKGKVEKIKINDANVNVNKIEIEIALVKVVQNGEKHK